MQYLNTMFWETIPDSYSSYIPNPSRSDPLIQIINEDWQRRKCAILGLTFDSVMKQPGNLIRQPLKYYQPWEADNIMRDGNCLFRCPSKIITGSQNSHLEIRSIIARFIASEGSTRLGWYFKSKRTTPCEYFFNENLVYCEGIWGSDVEIMAASAILDADIYVANDDYWQKGTLTRKVRWSLLRGSTNPNANIYITNYGQHFAPVISMINSPTHSYGAKSKKFQRGIQRHRIQRSP